MYSMADPRLEVPATAGEKIKIHLLSGYVWEVTRPPIGGPLEPYLYPDRPGRTYNNEDPVFHLGSEDYYFAEDHYSRLVVIFTSGITLQLPEVESGLVRVPLRVLENNFSGEVEQERSGARDHVWAVPKGLPLDWTDTPSGYSQTGEPWYHVVDRYGYEYNLQVEIDYSHSPPWAVVHKLSEDLVDEVKPETAFPEKPSKREPIGAWYLLFAVPYVLMLANALK